MMVKTVYFMMEKTVYFMMEENSLFYDGENSLFYDHGGKLRHCVKYLHIFFKYCKAGNSNGHTNEQTDLIHNQGTRMKAHLL